MSARSERTLLDRIADWLEGAVWLSEYIRVSPRGRMQIDVRHYLQSPHVQAQVAAVAAWNEGRRE